MIAFLLIVAAVAANQSTAVGATPDECTPSSPGQVLVCAQKPQPYRINPAVLEAAREHDAPRPKPPVTATASQDGGCIGGQGCTGGVVPLVAMALVAAKAAALAANGDDWRDAIRMHEDEYRLYKEAEERRSRERRPRIGFVVGR